MRKWGGLLWLIAMYAVCASAQTKPEWREVIGTWEGDSTCTVPSSPCHDEHVLFRVKPDRDDPEKLALEAFKVVDRKPQFMGTLGCQYAEEEKVLTCSGNTPKRDVWTFNVAGTSIDGTLTTGKEKTLYRKVTLRKK